MNEQQTFKEELFKKYAVTESEKTNRAFLLAWQMGHAYGLHEVESYFKDFLELINL